MGDMGEVFNEMRQATQERRAKNTRSSTELLEASKVQFMARNGGSHLIVKAGKRVVDFWPSTGLWIVRGEKAKHGGVMRLIEYARHQEATA